MEYSGSVLKGCLCFVHFFFFCVVQPSDDTLIWKLYQGQWLNQGERGGVPDDVGSSDQPWWLIINWQTYKLLHCLSHCYSGFSVPLFNLSKQNAGGRVEGVWPHWQCVIEGIKQREIIATMRISCPKNKLAWDLLLIYSWWAYSSHICPLLFDCGLKVGFALKRV